MIQGDENVRFALEIILTVLGATTLIIFRRISDDIRVMSESVQTLNVTMAVVLEKVGDHGTRITKLEENR